MPSGQDVAIAAFAAGFTPEPLLTVSEWSDEHRILSGKSASEPGPWRTSRVPFIREIADALSVTHPARRVVLQKGAQIAGTETGNNWIGYVIHHAPGPMLMVQPTVDVAKRVSKQRIAPMIEATPALRSRVREARARDSGNTMFIKEFDGGLLILTGANSGAGLRSMPIRYLFCDEIDEYPGDVDGQGDPVSLAEKRTTTFPRRKIFLCSTPKIKGLSRIEREFLTTDQRRYFIPCPHCGNFDWIRWSNIRWEENRPETAVLFCEACKSTIAEHHKPVMLDRGEWRATAQGDGRSIGFHLSGLYSPLGWKSWSECVEEFLAAKGNQEQLKTWVNTVLGETWEERGETVSPTSLMARAERYEAEVPSGVLVLTAGIDTQDDRLEVAVKGYGAGEESWLIAYHVIQSDPARPETWLALDEFLRQPFQHADGSVMRIERASIDTQGHRSEYVYQYVRSRLGRINVWAIRGGQQTGLPLVGRPSVRNQYRVKLYTLCVDTGKEIVYARLALQMEGPGYMHLPEWIDDVYCKGLTSEKAVRRYKKGQAASVKEWVQIYERNEPLDCEVYALSALYMLGEARLKALGIRSRQPRRASLPAPATPALPQHPAPPAKKSRPPRRPGGWVTGWRR